MTELAIILFKTDTHIHVDKILISASQVHNGNTGKKGGEMENTR